MAASDDPDRNEFDRKDEFYGRLGLLAEEMISAFGKDFTMGVLILAARFIAEGKPLSRLPKDENKTV